MRNKMRNFYIAQPIPVFLIHTYLQHLTITLDKPTTRFHLPLSYQMRPPTKHQYLHPWWQTFKISCRKNSHIYTVFTHRIENLNTCKQVTNSTSGRFNCASIKQQFFAEKSKWRNSRSSPVAASVVISPLSVLHRCAGAKRATNKKQFTV